MRKHIATLLLISACVTHAQSSPQQPDTLTHTLRDVEVSARYAPKAAMSTAPLRVYDQGQMLRTGVTDVSDALHRMPGVNLRDYGGAGGLKTVSVRGFGAGHTGVNYDGVPLSDVQTGQIDLSRYSIDNVKAVSMVIGDNDDIFIPARLAASAATVGISSLPSLDNRELNAKLRFGSFGLINPYLRIGTPLGEDAAINFVGEFTHAKNDYPFRLINGDLVTWEHRTNSRMNSGHGEINYICRPSTRASLTTKAYFYSNSRQLPGPVIYYNNVNHEHLREQNVMAQSQLRLSVTDRISLNAIAKYNYASSLYHDEDGQYPGGVLDQNYWQREYYGSCAMLYAISRDWLMDYSADYFHNNLNSNLPSDQRPYRNSVLQTLTAKYRTRHLTATARMLYSLYLNGCKTGSPAKDASRLSPSLSLSWQPMSDRLLFVRTSYKNIFRMPTFSEAYFDHYGSKDILPESTDQINLGATYTAQSRGVLSSATFTLDGYLNSVRDMIVGVPYNMFIWRMVNLGKVRIIGIDANAEVALAPTDGQTVSLSANYSYQRAMVRTDRASSEWMKQVAYIPKHSGNVALSYENPWANISVYGTGVSDRYTTNNNLPATRIAGYMEFGATIWRTLTVAPLRHIDLRLDLLNLLNKQYCVVARYPMPGRSFKVTIGIRM